MVSPVVGHRVGHGGIDGNNFPGEHVHDEDRGAIEVEGESLQVRKSIHEVLMRIKEGQSPATGPPMVLLFDDPQIPAHGAIIGACRPFAQGRKSPPDSAAAAGQATT